MEKFITLKNDNGMEVCLTNLGASIYYIKYQDVYMTLTPKNIDDFKRKNVYYGKTIGPIANRIENAILKIDNETFYYDANEGKTCLHSGNKGISNQLFDTKIEGNKVTFILEDKGVDYTIIYELKNDGLYLNHIAKAKQNTPISLTNHAYFCLGDENLNKIYLTIPSTKFVESRKEDLIPLKEKEIPPCLDFSKEKMIIEDIDDPYLQNHRTKGYDHCFILNKGEIELRNDKYQLIITTDYPCVHFYSTNYSDNIPYLTSDIGIHQGVAIEPEDNLLNRKILHPGETYHREIIYRFSTLK